ncbi:MAG: hypothetical protein AB7H71_14455 [Alphaproteobacteria bacterium]
MLITALDRAGGEDYLVQQARENPKAFMSLLARLVPTQVTGKDDGPLFAGMSDDELKGRIIAKLMTKGMSEDYARSLLHERY